MLTREIYEKGQVVIPKEVRDRYQIGVGTQLVFQMQAEGFFVKKARSVVDELKEIRKEDAIFTDREIEQARKQYRESLVNKYVH